MSRPYDEKCIEVRRAEIEDMKSVAALIQVSFFLSIPTSCTIQLELFITKIMVFF